MSRAYISVELRQLVYDRASGCCEYCLIPELVTLSSHEIDHIVAQKHGGETVASNLALSCTFCNKRKGSDIASIDSLTGYITPLFHPRCDRWSDHFQLRGAEIVPLTPQGRATVQLLKFNQHDRLEERQLLIDAGILRSPSVN